MKRLTQYNFRLKRWTIPTLQGIGGAQRVTEKLKAYEDTGLTPTQINTLKARYYKNSICINCKQNQNCNCSDLTDTISGEFVHPEIIRDDLTGMTIDCNKYIKENWQ